MSDNGVSIPPLRTGVVFAEWAPVVRDKLKAAKHGIIFRMPDPRALRAQVSSLPRRLGPPLRHLGDFGAQPVLPERRAGGTVLRKLAEG